MLKMPLTFPDLTALEPRGSSLSPGEKEILRGFQASVSKHLYLQLHNRKMENTWTLRGAELEKETRDGSCKFSFAHCWESSEMNTVLRCSLLFQRSHFFLVVDWFHPAQQDEDSQLWFSSSHVSHRSIVPVSQLSQPLVKGPDDHGNRWFVRPIMR